MIKIKYSLWIFFALYLLLPEYFALELTSSLPLITASRCILILLIFLCVIKNRIIIHIDKYFFLYIIILLSVNIFHITSNSSEAIKMIFSIVVEQLILYIVLRNLITSTSTIIKGINIMVKASGVVSILAILEAFTRVNIFYFLTTTNREMLQATYERLGFLRAEASFGHPVYFSVYLVCIIPFTLYFFENTNQKIYAWIAVLNIFAVLCTGSRAGIAVLIVLLLYSAVTKKTKIIFRYIKQMTKMVPAIIVLLIVFPQIRNYFSGIIGSLFSVFGINLNVEGFGGNSTGIKSRLMQFSGLIWTQEHNALWLGFGPGAHKIGLISYLNQVSGNWNTINSIDIGYVGYILLYGIVGAIGYFILYISLIVKAIKKSNENKNNNIFIAFKHFYLAYFVSLTSSVGLSSMFFVITILMYIYIDLERGEHYHEQDNSSGFIRSITEIS